MRRLSIFVGFLCCRRIGEAGERTRLGMGKRLDVCDGGRVRRLIHDKFIGVQTLKDTKLRDSLSMSTACPDAREQSAPVESIKKTLIR